MADSKSTDKLKILADALKDIPPETLKKVKSFSLQWFEHDYQLVVTNIKVEFYE